MLTLAALLALAIDWRFGEPSSRWHPVVWMGHYLSWAGSIVAPRAPGTPNAPADGEPQAGPDWRAFLAGTLAWLAGALLIVSLAWGLDSAIAWLCVKMLGPSALSTLVYACLIAVALKPLLAWAMLRDEVEAVETALQSSLEDGRQRLARLVSRDVAVLDAPMVRESAIESLAENLNDSVVAPIFWFLIGGLPAAALYRFANTADAMWGYREVRQGRQWGWAGKFAARADDVLSWLPARITALLLLVAGGMRGAARLRRNARLTPSPNSGWPMAAMALILNVRLSKPGVYCLNPDGHAPVAAHSALALRWAGRALLMLVLLLAVAGGSMALSALAAFPAFPAVPALSK